MVAIEQLGFPCHHMTKVFMDDSSQVADWIALFEAKAALAAETGERLPMRATLTDHESLARLERVLAKYPARVDFPSALFFLEQVELAKASGEDWVVLHTVRDSKSWVKSVADTIYYSIESKYGPGVNKPVVALQEACMRILLFFGYPFTFTCITLMVRRMGELLWLPTYMPDNKEGDYSLTKEANRAAMATSFDAHTEWVKSVVPDDHLVIFHPRDGWEPLCTALKVPVPDTPFPKVNSTEEFKARLKAIAIMVWFPVVIVATLFLLLPALYGLVGGAIRILAVLGVCTLCQQYKRRSAKQRVAVLKEVEKKQQ
jgi:hypothetical protein